MTEENFTLNFNLKAHAQQAIKELEGFTDSLGNVANAARTAIGGIGLAAGAAVFAAVKMAEDFDVPMRKVLALTGISSDEFQHYKDQVLELSTIVPKSAEDLANGLYFVVSAGFQGADAMTILEYSAKAASAGMTDTKIVADAVTSGLNAYKLTGKDAAGVTDLITEAVLQGKTEYGALAGSIGRVLPVAAELHVGLDEVLASMSTMTRVGLNADEAATALRGTLTALIKPSSGARKELDEMGLSAAGLRDELKSKGLMAVLQELMDKTGGNVEALSKIIPNVRALTGVLATSGSQGEAYAKILGSMKTAAGLTDDAFRKTADGVSAQSGILRNSLSKIAIELGDQLLPHLVDFAKWASEAVKATENWVRQNPDLAKLGLVLGGVAVGLAAISFVIGPLIALLGSPVLLPLLAVGAGVVALKKVWDENFGGIQEKTKSVADNVGSFLGGIKKGFVEQTTKTIPDYADAYDLARAHAINPFRESIARVTEGLPPLTTEMDNSNKMARDTARGVELAHKQMAEWQERGEKLGAALGWLWEKVLMPVAGWLVDTFIKNVEFVIEKVKGLISMIQTAISIAQTIGGAIGGALSGAQQALGGGAGQPPPAPGGGDYFGIPGFATGGVMPHDGLAYVHRDEEIRTPEQREDGLQPVHVYLDGELLMRTMGGRTLEDARRMGRMIS